MNSGTILDDAIVGAWHLVDADADESDLPQHRVDLVIRQAESGLTGAVLSRRDGSDAGIVLVERDGPAIRLQIRIPRADQPDDPPWLVLTHTGLRFEGQWRTTAGETFGPVLKLVRAAG